MFNYSTCNNSTKISIVKIIIVCNKSTVMINLAELWTNIYVDFNNTRIYTLLTKYEIILFVKLRINEDVCMAFYSHSEPTRWTSKSKGLFMAVSYHLQHIIWFGPYGMIVKKFFRIIFQILVFLVIMFVTLARTLTLVKRKAFVKMDLTFSSVILFLSYENDVSFGQFIFIFVWYES